MELYTSYYVHSNARTMLVQWIRLSEQRLSREICSKTDTLSVLISIAVSQNIVLIQITYKDLPVKKLTVDIGEYITDFHCTNYLSCERNILTYIAGPAEAVGQAEH